MKTQVLVNVEYFKDIIGINMAWDDACVGKGEISKQIQQKMDNAFKFFDVIIFQRIQNMPALALITEIRKKYPETKIVAEIDDSIGEISPSSPYKWGEQHRWSSEHLYMSDAVICSTEYLANSIKPIIGEKPVHIAPNCIQKKIWKFKKPKNNHKGLRIGYVGGGSHDEDLHIAYRAILPLLDKYPHVSFVIRYGGFRPRWLNNNPQIDFKSVAWHMDEYPQQLSDMDIDLALAPLRDSEFNRCKSNLKWIEWSSLNVPLLASDVEPYTKTKIQAGIILTDNKISSWTEKINNCIKSFKDGFIPDGVNIDGVELYKQNMKRYNIHNETKELLVFLNKLI
jgi:glycosyltransferase involved in cell wall biosynthesis